MGEILVGYVPVFLGFHMLGFIFGLGGATIADFLFFKFLTDFKITKKEKTVLDALSHVVWIGLSILILSGLLLFLSDIEKYSHSSKFLIKMVVVLVITCNGIVLNRVLAPRLTNIDWRLGWNARKRKMRRLAFALGSISVVSWYSAFILGLLRGLPYSFGQLFGAYAILLIGVVAGSQIMEAVFSWKRSK